MRLQARDVAELVSEYAAKAGQSEVVCWSLGPKDVGGQRGVTVLMAASMDSIVRTKPAAAVGTFWPSLKIGRWLPAVAGGLSRAARSLARPTAGVGVVDLPGDGRSGPVDRGTRGRSA